MNPILYESRETDFNHNGLGKMNETLSAIVTEVANGEFELEVVYPIGGRLYKHIQDHMLIKAKPNSVDDPHVFRIYEHIIDTVGQTVTIYAHTKSNDLGQNLVKDVVINSLAAQEAMNTMKTNLVEPTEYSFVSDITTKSSTEWKNRNPLNCIAGEEGSLIHYWGGEIKRDNRTIYLYRRRGRDNVAIIRDGKNINGLSLEYSTKGMVTKIIPYRIYTPENSDDEVVEYGTPVESQYIGNYPLVYVRAIDYSNDDDVTSLQTMNTKASRYFTENNGVDKPSVNVSMGLVELSDSSEYEKFKDFENVELFDTVTVYSKQYDIHIEAKITTVEYDSLAGKNISLEMGSYRTGLIESTERTYMELIGEKEAKLIQTIQVAANGKNRVFRGVDEPTTGMVKNDLWYKPIGDGETEMYQFDGAYWQLILSTLDTSKVQREVEVALSEAEAARQAAEQSYADSVAEAERLVQVQTDAFNAQMSDVNDEISTIKTNVETDLTNVNKAIADSFDSLSDTISEVDSIANQAKADADQALLDLKSKASTKALEDGLALKVATDTYNAKVKEMNSLISTAQSKADKAAADLLKKADATVVNAELAKKLATSTYNAKMNALDTAISGHTTRIEATEKGLLAKASTTDVNALKTRMSNAETSLTTNADTIALKASQEDLDTVEGRLETTEAELVVQAGEIASKVAKTDFNKLSGRVGTAESTITQHASEIASRVKQTDFDSLTGRVETAESSITQQAGLIASKVSQTDFDGVNGRLKTAESSITQQAGQIALKANTTTVNALASRVSTAEASLSVQSGKIDLAATKTELNNAIDGIEIGGRNLLVNSDFSNGLSNWVGQQGGGAVDSSGTLLISNGSSIYQGVDVEKGAQATASIKAKGTGSIQVRWGDSNSSYQQVSKAYKTYVFNVPRDGNPNLIIEAGTNSEIMVERVKLERGNKATDWTPAPEDVDSAISTVQANLTVEAGKIASKVSQTDFNALNGRVGTAESSITQHAGQIALKASQTSVDTLSGRVGTAETNISANTTAINLRATKSSVDTLTGRVTTAEGSITTQAGQIALRATTATVNALTGRVSTAETAITANTTAINLRATKTELTTAIEGVEVGGRNLLLNTDFSKETSSVEYWAVSGEMGIESDVRFGHVLRVSPTIQNGIRQQRTADFLEEGEYSWSVWLRADTPTRIGVSLQGSGNAAAQNVDVTTEWKLYAGSKAISWTNRVFRIYVNDGSNIPNFYVAYPKLEKGNKATDWTPAPEDVDAAISAVQANLTVEAGKITALTTRVSGSETNITKVTQTVSGHTSTISTLRTDVNGKATVAALNEVKSTADGNKTTISNHAGRLTTVESNVNGLQTTVSNKADKTQITQLSNSISTKVESATYNTKMTQLDSAINLRVVQGDITAAILADKRIKDTRTTNQLPTWYFTNHPYQRVEEFKGRTVLGVPGASMYAKLVTDVPWSDSSGGVVVQTAYTSDGVYTRSSNTAGSAWGSWVKQTDSSNVLAQVNLSTEGVLIQGKRIQLDGDVTMTATYVTKLNTQTLSAITANITSIRSQVLVTDSVTSTHIKAENALIDGIFGTTALITRLTSKTAFVDNIKAIEISADKVTTGTLNAANVNITNLNVSKIVGLDSTFVQSNWNANGTDVSITGNGIESTSANSSYARMIAGEVRSYSSDSNAAAIMGSGRSQFFIDGTSRAILGRTLHGSAYSGDASLQISYGSGFVIGRYDKESHLSGVKLVPYITFDYGTKGNEDTGLMRFRKEMDIIDSGFNFRSTTQAIGRIGKISTSQNIGIYSDSTLYLGVNGGSNYASNVAITRTEIKFSVNLNMGGKAITNQSDRRLKTRISTTLINALSIHRQLNFVDFDWIDKSVSTERQFGLIAQDAPFIGFEGDDGKWNINSSKQVMLNSLGIKELDETVTRIETFTTQHELEIKLLKDRITQLEEKIA